jgi:Zn-dependent protease with chaperone function
MNFFERQVKSRKTTRRLVSLFVIAVVAVVVSVYFAIRSFSYIYYVKYLAHSHFSPAGFVWFDQEIFYWAAGITLGVIGLGSLIKIRSLGSGGCYVAELLGGRLLDPDSTERLERRLFNVVEEMSIASGVPVPLLYVMDREESINAFAAGYEPASAVVAVTRGCLTMFNRDELQAVVAHEFSHILSGDMRLNIRLIGLLGGIMSISYIGVSLMRGVRGRLSIPFFFVGLTLLIIGYVGVFFGRIIQCAVSRQREFLADAAAVQFTRNPLGLAAALKKIGGFVDGSRVLAPAVSETCHMFFANAIAGFFSTHPPLAERIKVLEPGFRGQFQKLTAADMAGTEELDIVPQEELPISRVAADAGAVAGSVGTVTREQISRGQLLLASIPEKLKTALANPLGAFAAVCCLLLDADPEKRGAQIRQLRSAARQPLISELLRLAPIVIRLDIGMRLPVLDLALPTLRQLSPGQYQNLLRCVKLLIGADRTITLYEFCLYTILTRRLASTSGAARPQQARLGAQEFLNHAAELLAALAHAGHDSGAAASAAFAAGAACLKAPEKSLLFPASRPSLAAIGKALQRCAEAPAELKKQLFDACAHCALHDSAVSISEAELLRAFAYCLDLPLPLFIPSA